MHLPFPTQPLRRTATAAALILALTPALAACGAGDDATADAGPDAVAEEGAFPATIEHKYGATEVTEAPERVVTVGLTEQDAVLALGVVPVGVTKWFGEAPGAIFPWATDALDAAGGELPEVLESADGIQVEKVAALEPDLIIAINSGMTEQEYDLLSRIAPTVASDDEVDYTASWQDITETVGTALGRPAEATRIIEDVEGRLEAAAAEHPEFEGKQAAVVTAYEGLFVYGEGDSRGQMLEELGFEFPEVLEDPDSEAFGWSLSAERTSDLGQLDAVVWLDHDTADPAMKELFEGSRAFEEGRWFDISDADGGDYHVAQSMVTPLSIPYVLERYVPQLAAAVDGDPATEVPAVTG
ncbi:iron-siderophore ABC transporter substrate-binding protein [uncultured Nocardioides sp.]|uniref:iron-siderophore ABC transporter substrate-binding protein n=1 Tax=uncultured Nocardioides sp. TaxID=198441 RepID=UPI0025E5EE85|nr:iron-siderophore ABC transporter substrate-binding protein [uncultured Nocardioides sp.]